MSYVGICEVMLHLNNFSIFDEYSIGKYKLSISGFYRKEEQTIKKDEVLIKSNTEKEYKLPCTVFEDPSPYQNKSAYGISCNRSSDTEIELFVNIEALPKNEPQSLKLNHTVLWRGYLPSYPENWNQDIFLSFSLQVLDEEGDTYNEIEKRIFKVRSPSIEPFVSCIELNYEKEKQVLINGLIYGVLLGFEYFSLEECKEKQVYVPGSEKKGERTLEGMIGEILEEECLGLAYDSYVGALKRSFCFLEDFLKKDQVKRKKEKYEIEFTNEYKEFCKKFKIRDSDMREGSYF